MEKIKQIWTDSTFNAITANGMREMDEIRFYQACQEIINTYEREKVKADNSRLHGISVTPDDLRKQAEQIYQETVNRGFSPKVEGNELEAVMLINYCADILEQLHSR